MRLERLALLALFACNTDIGVTEAENSAPTISATLLGGPFRPGDEVTVQATADDQEDPWDLLQVSIDVPEATLEGPIEVAGGGQWTWTFEAIPDLESISVTAIDRQEAELFQRAIIQPAVDFGSLEMVFVITDFRTIDTSIFDTLPDELDSTP